MEGVDWQRIKAAGDSEVVLLAIGYENVAFLRPSIMEIRNRLWPVGYRI